MQTNAYRYCDYYNHDHICWEQFHSYIAYEKNMCEHTVAEMPKQKRWAFLGAVRTTFNALRSRHYYSYENQHHDKAHNGQHQRTMQELELSSDFVKYLFSEDAKTKIAMETDRWMHNRRRSCTEEIWFFVLMHDAPFERLYHADPVLKYMLGNIGCACPMLQDITEARSGLAVAFVLA